MFDLDSMSEREAAEALFGSRLLERQPALTSIEPLRIQRTDPPLFTATVAGRPLDLTAAELASFPRFKRRCIAALGLIPRLPCVADNTRQGRMIWDAILARAFATATEEIPPEDATPEGVVWDGICRTLLWEQLR